MKLNQALRHLYAPEYLLGKRSWEGEPFTAGQVYKSLSIVAWPAAAEAILIGLMSFVDTMMVATVGAPAIAATGLTNQPRMLFFAMFFALNAGVTAIVSRRRGEKDSEGANKCLAQALIICVILSLVVCALALTVSRPMMYFAGANEDTIDDGVIYFKITMVGMAFMSLGMVINAAQRGVGNTKISMRTNLIANAINVIFNYLLINGIWFFPKLGVKGAAIATLLGNLVSCFMSFISVLHKGDFLYIGHRENFKYDREHVRLLLKIGSAAAVEQLFVRIGFFFYTKTVATLGTLALATHNICMSIISLSFTVGDGLGIGAASLVGQNLGRKRPDLAVIYGKAAQRIGLLISTALVLLFWRGGGFLMGLFTKDEQIIKLGIKLLYIVALASPAQVSQLVFSGSLRGAGDTKFVAYSSLTSMGLVRPIITYILCFPMKLGLIGAWISLLIDQYMRLSFSAYRFLRGKWLAIKI